MLGDFLPVQLIYTGKTKRCHPPFSFPKDWLISHTPNHWSNEESMIDYIIDGVRARLNVGDNQAALAIFDHFKGQMTTRIMDLLESNNIQCVMVPPGCTDRLQPLDVSVNTAAKAFLKAEFQKWYAVE